MKGLLLKDWHLLIKRLKFVLLVMACLALVFLSINMPIMFRLGVEKGRLIFMLLICGGTFGGMYFKDKLFTLSGQIDSVTMPILFIAVFTVIIVCASILIVVRQIKRCSIRQIILN